MKKQTDNRSSALEVPTKAKHDLNLVLRSCFVLSRKDQRKKVVRRWKAKSGQGETKEYEIEISSVLRLPWFRDNEVLMMYITKSQQEDNREIEISEYEVLKWLGLSFGKKNYQGLRASNERLTNVRIKGSFWLKNEQESKWIEHTKWGGLLDTVEWVIETDKRTGKEKLLGLKVRLSSLIWEDIKAGNLLTFNLSEYRSLKGDSVRAIYLYVSSMRVNRWEVDIFQLAETHLGMGDYKYASEVWRQLQPILKRAKLQGVIEHYERVKRGKYWRVLLVKPAKQLSFFTDPEVEALEEQAQESNNGSGLPDGQQEMVKILVDKGIGQTVARRLASRYNRDRILEKIDFLEYLQETDPKKVTNPRGWLRRAIEENYGKPDGYKSQAEQEAEAAAVEQRRQVQMEQEALRAAQEAEERERQQQTREAQLKSLRERYSTSENEKKLWETWVAHIGASDQMATAFLHTSCELLSASVDQLVIWVANDFIKQQFQRRYSKTIRQLAARHFKIPLTQVNLELLMTE